MDKAGEILVEKLELLDPSFAEEILTVLTEAGYAIVSRADLRKVETALFHWFECEQGECGHLNNAMENIALADIGFNFRKYREIVEDPFVAAAAKEPDDG